MKKNLSGCPHKSCLCDIWPGQLSVKYFQPLVQLRGVNSKCSPHSFIFQFIFWCIFVEESIMGLKILAVSKDIYYVSNFTLSEIQLRLERLIYKW